MKQNVNFDSQGFRLSAHLYLPYSGTDRLPAVIVNHPASGVKEQTAGLYAERLSQLGFITLAYDSAYQGESEGTPRGLEDPAQRVEDIKSAVSYLSLHERVDASRIGLLGICASDGYAITAAATDIRIKAVATVSGVDIGAFFRKGYNGKQDPSVLQMQLGEAAKARTAHAASGETASFSIQPPDAEVARELGQYVYEGYDYYMTPRGFHPRSAKVMPWNSVDKIASFDGFRFIGAIAPRPVLMVVGTQAETKWLAEEAMESAGEPKELFWIEGASHVGLYDKDQFVTSAVVRLGEYFRAWLV